MRVKISNAYKAFISGMWFVNVMRQIVVTGGNIAESAFLLATLWVIINAVAHTLLTWFMSTQMIELFNYLAVVAFSALPELIIIPVIIICFTHWSCAVKQRNKVSVTWAVLYSVPAVFFLVLTVLAITKFVSTGGTEFVAASGIELVVRCLSGWMYAVVNMLFQKLGEPHYASRMEEKNAEIVRLKEEIERQKLANESELNELKSDYSIERQELLIQIREQNQQLNRLSERASSLDRNTLENYPIVAIDWVENGKRTVSTDELIAATGVSKQKIAAAIRSGKIQKDNRNKDLIRVSSVVEWLKTMPLPEPAIATKEVEEIPESDRRLAKIIEFHLPNVYPQNGA